MVKFCSSCVGIILPIRLLITTDIKTCMLRINQRCETINKKCACFITRSYSHHWENQCLHRRLVLVQRQFLSYHRYHPSQSDNVTSTTSPASSSNGQRCMLNSKLSFPSLSLLLAWVLFSVATAGYAESIKVSNWTFVIARARFLTGQMLFRH